MYVLVSTCGWVDGWWVFVSTYPMGCMMTWRWGVLGDMCYRCVHVWLLVYFEGMALKFACVFISTVYLPLDICMYQCLGSFPDSVLVCRFVLFCFVWDWVSLCNPGWTGILYVAQVGLQPTENSANLCLLSSRIKGIHHHTWLMQGVSKPSHKGSQKDPMKATGGLNMKSAGEFL